MLRVAFTIISCHVVASYISFIPLGISVLLNALSAHGSMSDHWSYVFKMGVLAPVSVFYFLPVAALSPALRASGAHREWALILVPILYVMTFYFLFRLLRGRLRKRNDSTEMSKLDH